MNLSNYLINWKTTSSGLLSIIGGITRIGFAAKSHMVTEESVMTAATTILLGAGLLFARDVNVSSVDLGLQTVEPKAEATEVVVDKPTIEKKP